MRQKVLQWKFTVLEIHSPRYDSEFQVKDMTCNTSHEKWKINVRDPKDRKKLKLIDSISKYTEILIYWHHGKKKKKSSVLKISL